VLGIQKGKFAFVHSFGARMDGPQKLIGELTVASGKVVWDLNGRTRDHWDRLGKYQALGEPTGTAAAERRAQCRSTHQNRFRNSQIARLVHPFLRGMTRHASQRH
jgi:hypothetical protein